MTSGEHGASRLDQEAQADRASQPADARWLSLFEDRYGVGSYRQLVDLFGQPCVTFADIAGCYGVSRERVRQWHMTLLPDAPRGHERQQLCRVHNQRRRLLEEPLFRSFYRHARPHLPPGRIQLIRARDGFRTRTVRVDNRTVAIRSAGRCATKGGGPDAATYRLTNCRGSIDLIYYRLDDAGYLLLPKQLLPPTGALFLDAPSSRYWPFKNSFDAINRAALTHDHDVSLAV